MFSPCCGKPLDDSASSWRGVRVWECSSCGKHWAVERMLKTTFKEQLERTVYIRGGGIDS